MGGGQNLLHAGAKHPRTGPVHNHTNGISHKIINNFFSIHMKMYNSNGQYTKQIGINHLVLESLSIRSTLNVKKSQIDKLFLILLKL